MWYEHGHLQETRILVSETVVVLSPDCRCEKDVERGNLLSPFYLQTLLDPLAVLVDHGVDNVDERLVAVEQTMSTGENVAFKPSLEKLVTRTASQVIDVPQRCALKASP